MDHVYSRRLARSSYLPPLTLSISPFEISVARDKLTGLVAHYTPGQEDIQEIEEPDTTNNNEEVQKNDKTEGVIEIRDYVLSDESGTVLDKQY